jgi:hypothetical protein
MYHQIIQFLCKSRSDGPAIWSFVMLLEKAILPIKGGTTLRAQVAKDDLCPTSEQPLGNTKLSPEFQPHP